MGFNSWEAKMPKLLQIIVALLTAVTLQITVPAAIAGEGGARDVEQPSAKKRKGVKGVVLLNQPARPVLKRKSFGERATENANKRRNKRKIARLERKRIAEVRKTQKAQKDESNARKQLRFQKTRLRKAKAKRTFKDNKDVRQNRAEIRQAQREIRNYENRIKGAKKRYKKHKGRADEYERQIRALL